MSGDLYGAKTVTNYLNPAAFAQPASGKFGTHVRNSIKGPGFWKVDLALSRLVSLAATSNLEFRVDLGAGTFGRITTTTGDPRIMQFGVKYGF